MKEKFLDFSPQELEEKLLRSYLKEKERYRLKQICKWVFEGQKSSFLEMSNLPEQLRTQLEKNFCLRSLKVKLREKSSDGTTKFTFETFDGKDFTAVLLPHTGYYTLCLSTQVGCAWNCQFCASGLVSFDRNLSSGEILDQIFLIQDSEKIRVKNILFMGMGEPLANYSNLVYAVEWLISPHGFKMNPSHITLSTTGVVPQIKKLGLMHFNINFALSLHSADEKIRKKIMPVSSKYTIEEVLGAVKLYQSQNRGDLTIEYILLEGVNDSLKEAEKLVHALNSVKFKERPKINLIPYNPIPKLPFRPSKEKTIEAFFKFLKSKNFIVHTRKPQGQDIGAACGQLS